MDQNDLYVHIWGKGERIVFIHGGGIEDSGMIWSKQHDLANHYQLIVPDRRGYGRSPRREHQWTFENDVEDMLPLLGGRAHLVGSSVGGVIALLIAGQRPSSIRSLTVIEPPTFGIASDQVEVSKVIEAMRPVFRSASTPEAFLADFMRVLGWKVPEPMRLSLQERKRIEAMMKEPEPWDTDLPLEALAMLPCPKLVVSGDWHPAFAITADRLAQYLHAERLMIKGAEHAVQKIGKQFNDRLIALISSAQRS